MDSENYYNGINLTFLESLPIDSWILDYGCGQGAVSRFLLNRGFYVAAADIDPTCEQALRSSLSEDEDKRLQFFVIQSQEPFLPEGIGLFNCIICREVLEHVADPFFVIKLFSKHLAKDGLLVLSVPTFFTERYFCLWDRNWLQKSEHLNVFPAQEIRDLLAKNRLMIVAEEGQSFRWTLFWIMLSPFCVKHKMGNPESNVRLVRLALKATQQFCKLPGVERAGNWLLPKSRFYYATKRKPRILVVYDYQDWILGKWAANIRRVHGLEFDIVEISMFHAQQDRNYAATLSAKVDIIHLLLPHPYHFFRDLAPGKAFITTIHHWVDWSEMYSQPASQSHRLVTGAEEWKKCLVAQGVKPEYITVVHSGVEDRFFQDVPALLPLSLKLTAGFFAKMDSNESDRKGTRHFLRLAEYICQKSLQNRFRLVISGPGWKEQVTALQAMGIETVYLPYVEDQEMPALYRSLDVYLMLSDVEGGPATIAEAMASNCLVFSTNIGVARDIVEDSVTGLLVNNTDPAGILDRLLYCQAHPEQSQVIREKARLLAHERMRYDQTLAGLCGLYKEVFNLNIQLGKGYLDPKQDNKVTTRYSARVKP